MPLLGGQGAHEVALMAFLFDALSLGQQRFCPNEVAGYLLAYALVDVVNVSRLDGSACAWGVCF